MKLEILTVKEFTDWAINNEEITFHQTKEWADLKKRNGWNSYYVGLKDKGIIKAASLILAKEIPVIKKKMFYAPRGFLIDYHDSLIMKAINVHFQHFDDQNQKINFQLPQSPFVLAHQTLSTMTSPLSL